MYSSLVFRQSAHSPYWLGSERAVAGGSRSDRCTLPGGGSGVMAPGAGRRAPAMPWHLAVLAPRKRGRCMSGGNSPTGGL